MGAVGTQKVAKTEIHRTVIANTIFFFWRGRYCTRLGPYNCVSSEKLSEKHKGTRLVRKAGKSVNKQNQSHTQSDPQIPQPDLRFAANQTAKQHRKRGRAQQKTTTMDLPCDTGIINSITVKNMQTNQVLRPVIQTPSLSAKESSKETQLRCHSSPYSMQQIGWICKDQLHLLPSNCHCCFCNFQRSVTLSLL